jgi:hypothetical protein
MTSETERLIEEANHSACRELCTHDPCGLIRRLANALGEARGLLEEIRSRYGLSDGMICRIEAFLGAHEGEER